MKKKTVYTDEDIGELVRMKDDLPPPEDFILKEKMVRVTINLSESSVSRFKLLAKKHKTQYQSIIRKYLDYAAKKVACL